MAPRALVLLLFSLMGCGVSWEAMSGRSRVLQCRGWARNRDYDTVEGAVSGYVSDKTNTRFKIAGRWFRFRQDLPPGTIAGGDLRYGRIWLWPEELVELAAGQHVRINHHDGTILQIERLDAK